MTFSRHRIVIIHWWVVTIGLDISQAPSPLSICLQSPGVSPGQTRCDDQSQGPRERDINTSPQWSNVNTTLTHPQQQIQLQYIFWQNNFIEMFSYQFNLHSFELQMYN